MSGRLWIKICGMRSVEAIDAAVAAGADAVGFVFYAPSPRHLEPWQARELAGTVPAGVQRVAVFLHPTQALVDAAIDAVTPDWVQTDADDLLELVLPVGQKSLPVFRTGRSLSPGQVGGRRFLLESAQSGAGAVADWTTARALARSGELVLAGGLDVANVADAISAVRPFGIDVSSGVERSRGVKDPAMIRDFVDAARAAAAREIGDIHQFPGAGRK